MIAEALSWTLLHSLWQIAGLAALLALASPWLRRMRASSRYLLYCSALLVVPIVAVSTFIAVWGQMSASRPTPWPTGLWQSSSVSSSLGAAAPWLVAAWLVGVAFFSLRLLAGCLEIRRLRRDTTPLDDPWRSSLGSAMAELADAMAVRASVAVAESLAVTVPTLVGWLRPVILLPVGVVTGLSSAELQAVLAHELAHVRRHDAIVNLVQSVIETLFFYHPAMRWLSGRIREEREYCCDDLAVATAADPITYALALTELEALRGAAPTLALTATTATAINPKGGPLMSRIRRLVEPSSHPARTANWLVPGLLALAVISAAMIAACEVDPDETGTTSGEIGENGQLMFIDESGAITEFAPGQNDFTAAKETGQEAFVGRLEPVPPARGSADVTDKSTGHVVRFIGEDGSEHEVGPDHVWVEHGSARAAKIAERMLQKVKLKKVEESDGHFMFVTEDGRTVELKKVDSPDPQ